MTLWDRLTAPETAAAEVRIWTGDRFATHRWSGLLRRGERAAAALRRAGIGPGEPVGAVLTNSAASIEAALGIWSLGAIPASMPVPARGMQLDEYESHLFGLCTRFDIKVLLVDAAFAPLLGQRAPNGLRVLGFEDLDADGPVTPAFPSDGELAFIQCSSGSTQVPKGCALTTAAIDVQLGILNGMAGARPGAETIVSWLPLSHDMGFFGCLMFAWYGGNPIALSTPERFAASPRTWFSDAVDLGGTMTAGTSSALHYAARAVRHRPLTGPLRFTTCVIGAERIEWDTLRTTLDVLEPYGFTPQALMPAYGMAEATLVVTAIGIDEAPRVLAVDSEALGNGEIVPVAAPGLSTTSMVSVGRPCAGVSVELAVPGTASEILVRSPTLASGYYADPERTAQRFTADGLRTGDLGFIEGGELFVVGRTDDVLSVGGRKVYAHEVEAAIGTIEGVRTGCCALVEVPHASGSRLVVLAELRDPGADRDAVAAATARLATAKAGITIDECIFLEKGTLPKTPTGKVQRFRCRQLAAAGGAEAADRYSMAG